MSAWTFAQEQINTTITITVPERGQAETIVKVSSPDKFAGSTKPQKPGDWYAMEVKGEGETRVLKVTIEKGKLQTFKIHAVIEPNNYTKITRKKEITIKGGENDRVKLDMTKDQAFEEINRPDDIVVRFVPTPDDIVDEMSKLAKIGKDDVVYDLGCGNAVMLIRPIQKFGAKKGVGVEYDPKIMEEAKKNVRNAKLQDRIELRLGDMLKIQPDDVADATVVLLYIGDDLGKRVSPVLKNALKPGSRIVSHRFMLGDWTPTKSVTVKGADTYEYDLHLWIVPERKAEKGNGKP
jgi:tRNA A58 N-methylase Trm61